LDEVTSRRISDVIDRLRRGEPVDIRKLEGTNEHRIRVGDYRLRIEFEPARRVNVLRVLHRREAYPR
jgi:mRNA-degrading endonuclease RelE of RelBE toxin-antitoxin system